MADIVSKATVKRWLNSIGVYGYESKVDALPTIEAEPVKHGHWVKDGHHIRCSECEICFCDKDREGDAIPTDYCPNCGAKMGRMIE